MITRIMHASNIPLAAELLKQGKPIVFPTETVYGLGALVFDIEAVSKIFLIKNRPPDNPLIVHISSIEEAALLSSELPSSFFLLAKQFWPGPLTLVLKRNEAVPAMVSAGHSTIAIRMPSHPTALELIRACGQPIAAPSANLSGRPSPTRARDAFEDVQGKVELILDGGECSFGIESTVLHLNDDAPILLRPGSITQGEIEEVLQKPVQLPSRNSPIVSPGMKYRHYAPQAKVRLVFHREELYRERWKHLESDEKTAQIFCSETSSLVRKQGASEDERFVAQPMQSETYGSFILSPHPRCGERLLSPQTLYAEFREADRLGIQEILIDCDPSIQKNAALMNRLLKAGEVLIK